MVDLSLRSQYQEASRLVAAGRPKDALDIGQRILASFPRHVPTYVVLGQAYARLGNRNAAVDLFRRALCADPECSAAYYSLGQALVRRGEFDEAHWHLERAFELAPGDPAIRRAVAEARTSHGEYAPDLEPTSGALARIYLRGGLYAKAAQELAALLEDDADRPDLRVALAEALWRSRRWPEAEMSCQKILAELPNCLKANLILGTLWLGTPREQEGRALLARAQSLDPDNEVAQNLLGRRSPLPKRMARLPFREGDAPELDLPYLSAAEEEQGQEERPPEPRGESRPAAPPEPRSPIIVAGQRPRETQAAPTRPQEARPADKRGPAEAKAEPAQGLPAEEGLTLLDLQRQYVAEHPEDSRARLDLARQLRDHGLLAESLEQYGWIVENDYGLMEEALPDLEFLARLYPRTPELEALLGRARAQAKQVPTKRQGEGD